MHSQTWDDMSQSKEDKTAPLRSRTSIASGRELMHSNKRLNLAKLAGRRQEKDVFLSEHEIKQHS